MIVVDSSVWIEAFSQRPTLTRDRLDALIDRQELVVGDLILTEVLQGFRDEQSHRKAKTILTALPVESMAGRDAALAAADAYRTLRRRGVTPRNTIDVLIACHCVRHGHVLLHADRDFDLMAPILDLQTV